MKDILKQGSKIINVGSDKLIPHNIKVIKKNYERFFKDLSKDKLIVDLGCGWNVTFLQYLEKSGFHNIIGVDLDTHALQKGSSLVSEKVQLVEGDIIQFLETSKQKIDVVIMRHVIEHIPKTTVSYIFSLLHEKLNKGGFVLMETPNVTNRIGLNTYFRDFTHETAFSGESLQQAGYVFSVSKIYPVKYPIINTLSVKHFFASTGAFLFAKLAVLGSLFSQFLLGQKGPYTSNVIGKFQK